MTRRTGYIWTGYTGFDKIWISRLLNAQIIDTLPGCYNWCNIFGEAVGEIWHWSLLGVKGLILLLPRVINFKFPLKPYQKYYTTQYEEVGFSSLTQMEHDYTTNSHCINYTFFFKWLGECTLWTWRYLAQLYLGIQLFLDYKVHLVEAFSGERKRQLRACSGGKARYNGRACFRRNLYSERGSCYSRSS